MAPSTFLIVYDFFLKSNQPAKLINPSPKAIESPLFFSLVFGKVSPVVAFIELVAIFVLFVTSSVNGYPVSTIFLFNLDPIY
jgi:hypothetical protein